LAKGDRRGFVATDLNGEVYAIARWCGIKTKDVRARLGKPDNLPSVALARENLAKAVLPAVEKLKREAARKEDQVKQRQEKLLWQLTEKHQGERRQLSGRQAKRSQAELEIRQERFNKGLRGLFDRITGAYGKTKRQNELEAYDALKRDQAERDKLVYKQLDEKRDHLKRQRDVLHKAQRLRRDLKNDLKSLREKRESDRSGRDGP